jgi:hypothetical protein
MPFIVGNLKCRIFGNQEYRVFGNKSAEKISLMNVELVIWIFRAYYTSN